MCLEYAPMVVPQDTVDQVAMRVCTGCHASLINHNCDLNKKQVYFCRWKLSKFKPYVHMSPYKVISTILNQFDVCYS